MRRRALVLVAAATALVLAGCSSANPDASASTGGAAKIDDIVIGTSDALAPTVTLPENQTFREAQGRIVWEGEGAPLVENQPLLLDIYAVSLEDGAELVNTYDGLPQPFVLAPEVLGNELYELLIDSNVGTRAVVVTPANVASGVTPSAGEEPSTVPDAVIVIDVLSERAVGTAVEPRDDLPSVTVNSDTGEPTIVIDSDLDEPTTVQSETLIQGGGEQIKSGSYILVNYKAMRWDGTEFESSWPEDKAPFSTQIGTNQVIRAWDEALLDQSVGSQVLIVAPPAAGYPDEGTLVFVVDILDVWTPVE
jgi:peptidylprolyl isomerase